MEAAMLEQVATPNARACFWAAIVVAIGGALVLFSLVVSFRVLLGLGLGWLSLGTLSIVVLMGLILLWSPILLLLAISGMAIVVPVNSPSLRLWRDAGRDDLGRRELVFLQTISPEAAQEPPQIVEHHSKEAA
jgi:hypothetical protein